MSSLRTPVDPAHDHILGPSTARLTLVEYADLECPHCARAALEVAQVLEQMRGELRFVFRHFPLSEHHPHAVQAAEAAEAAGAQDRFWEMCRVLFENQAHLEESDLVDYARQQRIDVRAVVTALDDHRYLPRIRNDFTGGVRSGVMGTPAFFINGQRHEGAYDASSLLAALERAAHLDRELTAR